MWLCSVTAPGMDKAGHTKHVQSPYTWKGLNKLLMVLVVPDREQEKASVTSPHTSKPNA